MRALRRETQAVVALRRDAQDGVALRALRRAGTTCALIAVLAGCGDEQPAGDAFTVPPGAPTTSATAAVDAEQRHPDIVDVAITPAGEGAFDLAVTVSSPYDTPQRYADGWRVLAPDGTVLGTHTLAHDHAAEQPFTRTQTGLAIPPDVTDVTVEGRDQRYGYGGGTLTVPVPHDEG